MLGHDHEIVQVFDSRPTAPDIPNYVRSMVERRSFLVELAKSDLKGQQYGRALGKLWMILDPMFQIGIYFLVYTSALTVEQRSNRAPRKNRVISVM